MKSGSILMADDDDNDAMLLEMAFARLGPEPKLERVKDGEETIRYLTGEGEYGDRERYPFPTLLLLDLKMPGLSGFEVLDWIRRQPVIKWLVVTVLTASKSDSDICRAYDVGANSYLVKPSTLRGLEWMSRVIKEYWLETNLLLPRPYAAAPRAPPPEHSAR